MATKQQLIGKKCSCAGCKTPASVEVKTMWGNGGTVFFCDEHSPDWAKRGLKKSPEMVMFGVKKSWYELA